jgi:biopolymer transport protein ExbB
MVMLTIAISGGPFLGLLGTVVGVMITFAAIAASGDVNVNAIAPGIAAALAATVAGLAVAIPACSATTGSTPASRRSSRTCGCSSTSS